MDRDRVHALLASVGDEPHWQVCRELLDEYDKAVASRETWRYTASSANERADRLTADLEAAEDDCTRLVQHIIQHPAIGSDRVLELHDRRKQ